MASKKFAQPNIGPNPDITPNAYLAQQRSPIMAELDQKPWLGTWLAAIGEKELGGAPLPILESLVNRAAMLRGRGVDTSLEKLTSQRMGFYQTVNKGDVQRMIDAGIPQDAIDRTNTALAQIKAGSNVTQGAQDQGKASSISSSFKVPYTSPTGETEWFGDMAGGPKFRAKMQAGMAQAAGQQQTAQNAPPPGAMPNAGPPPGASAAIGPPPSIEAQPRQPGIANSLAQASSSPYFDASGSGPSPDDINAAITQYQQAQTQDYGDYGDYAGAY